MFRLKLLVILVVVMGLSACWKDDFRHVDIYVTADTSGFYQARQEPSFQNEWVGGFGILKNFVSTLQEPYLLFDGGNWFGSSPEGTLTKGSFITPFLSEIPYTAATISAGDFMYGWPALRGIIKQQKFPFIASNLRLENALPWPLHDYQIRTVGDFKIGIFGLVNLQNLHGVEKGRTGGVYALDPLQTAQEMAARLKEKGVNYIILLSSLGTPADENISDSTLAQEVEGIDLILSFAQDRPQAQTERINRTFLVYPKAQLSSVGHIRVFFDKNKQVRDVSFEDIALLKSVYGENNSLADRATVLSRQVSDKMHQKITHAPQPLRTSRTEESPLGALLAQCIHQWAKLDGALLNSSSIRSSLAAGDVMEYDVYKMYPYADNITFLTLKGEALTQALQNSLNAADNFPQLAGMKVTYFSTPAGKLIRRVALANGSLIRPQETYRLAVTDHILAGGFGHDYFINSLEFKNTFVEARQIMRACLLRQKQLTAPATNHFQEVK